MLNKHGKVIAIEETPAYKAGFRFPENAPGLTVMNYKRLGDQVFEFTSTGYISPEGAIDATQQEYQDYQTNLFCKNNTMLPVQPECLDQVSPNLLPPPSMNPNPTNPPFISPPRSEPIAIDISNPARNPIAIQSTNNTIPILIILGIGILAFMLGR
jgi:hypothetical protein